MTPKETVLARHPHANLKKIHDCLYHVRKHKPGLNYSGNLAWGSNPRQAWFNAAEKVEMEARRLKRARKLSNAELNSGWKTVHMNTDSMAGWRHDD